MSQASTSPPFIFGAVIFASIHNDKWKAVWCLPSTLFLGFYTPFNSSDQYRLIRNLRSWYQRWKEQIGASLKRTLCVSVCMVVCLRILALRWPGKWTRPGWDRLQMKEGWMDGWMSEQNIFKYLNKIFMDFWGICWAEVSCQNSGSYLPHSSLRAAAAGAGTSCSSLLPWWTDNQVQFCLRPNWVITQSVLICRKQYIKTIISNWLECQTIWVCIKKKTIYLQELFLYKATAAGLLVYWAFERWALWLWRPSHLHSPE